MLGWYIDRPDNMPAVKELSRYAQKYGKRFFICFTVAATNGEVYGGYQGAEHTISKDTMQYLTDIAVTITGTWTKGTTRRAIRNCTSPA